ncbi:hypothetical protein [Neobacillus drentensis]
MNYFRMAVLKVMVDLKTTLIGAEGAKTPEGVRGRGDPAGAKRLERKSTV